MKQWLKIVALIGLVLFFYVLFRRKKARDAQIEKEMKERYEESLKPKYYKFEHYTSEVPSADFSGGHIQDEYREFYREHFTAQAFDMSNSGCPRTVPGKNNIPITTGLTCSTVSCSNLSDNNSLVVPVNVTSEDGTYPGFVASLVMGNVPPQHHGMVTDANSSRTGIPYDNYSTAQAYTNVNKAMVYNGFDINLEQDPLLPHSNQNVKGMIGACDYEVSYHTESGKGVSENVYFDQGTDSSALLHFTYQPNGTTFRNSKCFQTSYQTEDSVPPINNTTIGARTIPLISKAFNDRYCYTGTCHLLNPEFENINIPYNSVYYTRTNPSASDYKLWIPSDANTFSNIGLGLLSCMGYSTTARKTPSSNPGTVPPLMMNALVPRTYDCFLSQCANYDPLKGFFEYQYYYTNQAASNAYNAYNSTTINHRNDLSKGGFAVNTSSINNNTGRISGNCSTTQFNTSSCTIQNPFDTKYMAGQGSAPKFSSWLSSSIRQTLINPDTGLAASFGGYYGGLPCLIQLVYLLNLSYTGGDSYRYAISELVHWTFIDQWKNMMFDQPISPSTTISGQLVALADYFGNNYYYNGVTLYNSGQINVANLRTTLTNIGNSITTFLTANLPNYTGGLPTSPPPYDGFINKVDWIFNNSIGISDSIDKLMYASYYAAGNREKLKALANSYFPGHDFKRSWMYAMYPEHRKKSRLYFDGYTADLNNRWASGSIKVNDPYEDFQQYSDSTQTNAFMGPNKTYTPPTNLSGSNTKDYPYGPLNGVYGGLTTSYYQLDQNSIVNQMVLKRSIVIPYAIKQSNKADGSANPDVTQPTTFPRVYGVIKFIGNSVDKQPLITFFWAHIPIYPGCGNPSSNLDIVDLYNQNDYSNNAYHDKIFLFYIIGDEYVSRTSSTTSPSGVQNTKTVTSGWKYNLNQKGVYPICDEDYYIEAVYHGQAMLARSNDDASQQLNIGNYNSYAENDISCTIDTSSNGSALGGKFGNFRFYVNTSGVFLYKDKANNGDFTTYTGLIPVPGMITCTGIKCWTPFREQDNSQTVFKSMVIQQGFNAKSVTSSVPDGSTVASTTLDVNTDFNYNNIQYQWENTDTVRVQKHPIHPEQVLRPVTLNSNMFAAEGWKILNIGGGSTFVTPTKQVPFTISNNQVQDRYFSSGMTQLNKWGLPASSNIIKGEWIQIDTGSVARIGSYSFSSRNGYGNDTTRTGPNILNSIGFGSALDRTISDWALLASTNNSDWVLLDRRKNQKFSDNNPSPIFTITYPPNYMPTAYRYFRLVISAVSINNIDLVWDVGNFYLVDYMNSSIKYSSGTYTTSIQDKIVKNINLSSSSVPIYNNPGSNNFNAVYDPNNVNGTLSSTSRSVIQTVTNGLDYVTAQTNVYTSPNVIKYKTMNTPGNLTYATNPIPDDTYYNQNNANYTQPASSSSSNLAYAFGTTRTTYASIHLNHYVYAWKETYSNIFVGQSDSTGYLRKPTFTGIKGVGPSFLKFPDGQVFVADCPTCMYHRTGRDEDAAVPSSYGTFSGTYKPPCLCGWQTKSILNVSEAPNSLSMSTGDNSSLTEGEKTWLTVFNIANSFGGNQTALLHAHWADDTNTVNQSLRVNGHKWDRPSSMFLNRSKYRYYSGTTSTAFTTISNNDTSRLLTEKEGDNAFSDSRFRWTLPFHTGSYLVSPSYNCPVNGSCSDGSTTDNIVPNYCFWIQDSATYTKLTAAGVPISSDTNFNMNIKLPGNTGTFNNVPKRCLGALYTNSATDTNLNTSDISTLCPSAVQYKAMGWKLCYLNPYSYSSTFPCPLNYYNSTTLPNAIINKYGTIAFVFMDAYSAKTYYDADPNKDISTQYPSRVFKAPGGCSTCNCQSTTLKKEETCSGGYCTKKISADYYQQMKQINGQENVNVYQFSDKTETQKWLQSEIVKEFYNSDAYKQYQNKKDTKKEHFDVCKIASGIFADGANFIMDITYNPIARLVSQLKPLRAMQPISLTAPDWSCDVSLDEVFSGFCSYAKTLGTAFSGIGVLFPGFARFTSEFVSAICNMGRELLNSITSFFSNAYDTIKSGLISFANGICSGFNSMIRGISAVGRAIWDGIQQASSAAVNFIVSNGTAAWNALSSAGSLAISYISSAFTQAIDWISAGISNILSAISNMMSSIINNLIGAITGAVGYVSNFISSIFSW